MAQWYESLFDNFGRTYDTEGFTQGTSAECDFIENEIKHDTSLRILDIGCGTGRHTLELTKRGYQVVGIDLSDSMLARAREKSAELGIPIDVRKADARDLSFANEFDLVIMLCEGAFPLMESDTMNFEILKNASKALSAGGKFIFTTLNALFPLYHSKQDFIESQKDGTKPDISKNTFDLLTFRDRTTLTIQDDSGRQRTLHCDERYYAPSEITWMLTTLGFKTIEILGVETGCFKRDRKLTSGDFEMLVIASGCRTPMSKQTWIIQ